MKLLSLNKFCRSNGFLLLGSFFLFIFVHSVSGQTAQATSPFPEEDYIGRIHQGDIIDIHVRGHLEYDWRGGLTPEGFLEGFDRVATPIFARCKTLAELSRDIDKLLAETLREPHTEIKFADRSQRHFATIDGAVQNPQRMQVRRPVRLSEVIVSAGGFTDRASGSLIISRPAGSSCVQVGNGETTQRFDIALADLLSGKPAANPLIVSGDLIVVIEASPVFLLGAVQTQGRIDHRPNLTVARAIDAAGGSTTNADLRSVKIFRRDGGAQVLSLDLEGVRKKQVDDIVLRPFDIIEVPSKGKPPRRLPPVLDNEFDDNLRRAKLPIKIIE